jgi:hypothetical protein
MLSRGLKNMEREREREKRDGDRENETSTYCVRVFRRRKERKKTVHTVSSEERATNTDRKNPTIAISSRILFATVARQHVKNTHSAIMQLRLARCCHSFTTIAAR